MKNKKDYTVEIVPNSNTKIVERGNINTPSTQIHDPSFSWISTGTSIKSVGVKLVLYIVKPVYLWHSKKPEYVPFMRSCPL